MANIKSNFSNLTVAIDKLQSKSVALGTSLDIIHNIEEKLKTLRGEAVNIVYLNLKNSLNKNSGLFKLKLISKILNSEENQN